MTTPPTSSVFEEKSARFQASARRILPLICLVYILNFLDRVNISYAAIDMTKALGFTSATYGFGAGLFFIGYFVLEIPASLAIERGHAQRWLFAMTFLWGLVAGVMGFVQTTGQFYAARFGLGLAEAGCFPGLVLYLSQFSTRENRARVFAYLVTGLPIANLVAAPVSSLLLKARWLGLDGWRWLFIVEALPTVVAAFLILAWLPSDPKASLPARKAENETLNEVKLASILTDARVLLLTGAWFFFNVAVYGFTFWLPLLLKRMSNITAQQAALLSALPFAIALTATLVVSKSSDRRRERHVHAAIPMMVFGGFLCLSVLSSHSELLALSLLCISGLGINSGTASFLTISSSRFEGKARAIAIGVLTSLGALGGFTGPYLMGLLNAKTHSFQSGILCLGCAGIAAGVLTISTRRLDGR